MSHLCRKCGNLMPKDRKGADQVCPECRSKSEEKVGKQAQLYF